MHLSVIIPCRNGADTIATQLDALAGQSWSEAWEVVVADNGSTDSSVATAARYRGRLPNLQIVDASGRRGAAYARNVGARAASGTALAFCDADDAVGVGWLAAMGEALSQHDFVASRFDIEQLNPLWIQENFRSLAQQHGLQKVVYPPYLPHAGGSGLGVKRTLHEAIGGFDESLLRLMDTDYCFRVQLTGVPLHFASEAVVHVRLRHEFRGLFRQACLWGQYNVLMYKRYRPSDLKLPRPWRRYLKRWEGLFWRLPELRDKAGRAAWIASLGWQVGRLQGSLKYRVPPV
jgi:glycosyltransferase involved in cell wall biosynthesis